MLLAELLEALGVKGHALRLSSLGTPETRAEYREELTAYLRAHEDRALARGPRARIDLNPMRAFDAERPRTASTMQGTRRSCSTGSAPRTPSTSRRCARCSTTPASGTSSTRRSCAASTTTRGRVFEFTSDALGAQSGVGGGGRYDRLIEQLDGPPTPASGWAAGVERMLLAAASCRSRPSSSTCSSRSPTRRTPARRPRSSSPARRAAPASHAQLELAGRSLKGQLKHADRIGARYVAIVGDAERREPQGHGSRASSARLDADDVIPTILRGSRLS